MNKIVLLLLTIAIMVPFGYEACARPSKKYTVTERQVVLRQKVAAGLKSNELTEKEANKLNSRLDSLNQDVEKMKSKNAGQLSYKDQGKVEKRLNSISLEIEKCELAKRVTAR